MRALASVQRYFSPREKPPRGAAVLARRGVRHGAVLESERSCLPDLDSPELQAEVRRRWDAAHPIHLPGVLRAGLARQRAAVRSTLELFERLRRGASFQDAVWSRLSRHRRFEPAGVSMDLGDRREIEKDFAHGRGRGRGRIAARDLYAKLSWISHDERDFSLRIRFSFGSEHLLDWQNETRRTAWADRLAEALFPESSVLTAHAPLVALLESLCGRRLRFSERIVYSNAPLGGALFHHDVEPHQLGVLYGQLAGETAWLALPKRELAAELAGFLRSTRRRAPRSVLRWLDREDDARLSRLLNHAPGFTRRLIERGAFLRLRAGDALLLSSTEPDDACWHSVFALGRRPSLAHSYGIFARRRMR